MKYKIAAFLLAFGMLAVVAAEAYAQCRQTVCNNTPHGYVCRCM